jgi:hypothetical protein
MLLGLGNSVTQSARLGGLKYPDAIKMIALALAFVEAKL